MISIIVPIYNVERYLNRCVESLVNQNYSDIEIILVDDGSPDRSGIICDKWSAKDSRIRVIHQQNIGVSAARNAGLAIAKGHYVGFCDPDDFIDARMYQQMKKALIETNADIAICGYNYYNEFYRLDTKRCYEEKDNELLTNYQLLHKLSDMPPTVRHGVVNKLFPRRIIDGLRFDETLKSCEDLNFLLDALSRTESAVFIHKPLYGNLVRQGSATHGGLNIRAIKDSFRVHDRMYQISKNIPALKSYALAYLLDICTLKYNQAKNKSNRTEWSDRQCLDFMREFIRKRALEGLGNPYIKFKTQVYYLLLWIRK